jgi:hypothetical protein
MADQFVDPEISRRKFDAEIAEFLQRREEYEKRGWFLVEHCFPRVFVVLAAPKLEPPAIVYGITFDYSNYDARPPSVVFVKPFGREPCKYKEIPPHLRLNRTMQGGQVAVPGMPAEMQIQFGVPQPLLQAFDDNEVPFLCIAGVLEYHEHPAHRGDAWELHRTAGAGRLVRLLEVISRFGVEPIRGYGVNLVPQVGLEVGPPPP